MYTVAHQSFSRQNILLYYQTLVIKLSNISLFYTLLFFRTEFFLAHTQFSQYKVRKRQIKCLCKINQMVTYKHTSKILYGFEWTRKGRRDLQITHRRTCKGRNYFVRSTIGLSSVPLVWSVYRKCIRLINNVLGRI